MSNFFSLERGCRQGDPLSPRKQDVIAFVNTVTQFIHRGSYAHLHGRKEVFVNLLVR